jgi:DNA-binding FrmR family transcriptional regulator
MKAIRTRSRRLDAPQQRSAEYLSADAARGLSHRLVRAEGHLRAVRKMVLDHRCADEILLQLSAVKAAINQAAAQVLDHELSACMNQCMEGNAEERLRRVTGVLATLLKHS